MITPFLGPTKPDKPGNPDSTNGTPAFLGWRMVAIAFIAYNFAVGLTNGSFGAALPAIQSQFGTSRAAASACLGLNLLVLGLMAPVVGNLARHVPLRRLMICGAALTSIGFLLLANAPSFFFFILVYGGFIGCGACLLGVIPAPALVSRWFEHARGKALGMAMMPFFLFLAPPISAYLVQRGGSTLLFVALACAFAALIPLLLLIVDDPKDVGQRPLRLSNHVEVEDAATSGHDGAMMSAGAIFGDIRFWLLSIGIGILTSASIAFVSHAAAIASDKGFTPISASGVLSAYGAGTVAGALIFGWLIDRIGPLLSLAINAGMQTVLWLTLLQISDFGALLSVSAMIGAGMGALVALHGASITYIFGKNDFSRIMGYGYLLKVPFLFSGPPLAGYLFDLSGNYGSTLISFALFQLITAILFVTLSWTHQSRIRRLIPVPTKD